VTYQWVDCDREFVRQRYNRIAGLITFFEWLLFLPSEFRQRAAQCTAMRAGDHVLEIGCGTGRNLPFLSEAVGPAGRVYGIDLSEGMLGKAREACDTQKLDNVTLIQADAVEYVAPKPLDGILFGLSYNTMPNHRAVLRNALAQLRPGGRIVIMDAKVPEGIAATIILPFSLWLMKQTLLGNPLIKPWEHLASDSDNFEMREFLFGSYYICQGTKRNDLRSAEPAHAELQVA
jgi:demethylmenaquinone methyltransferase/2-methoxy-6-polyprenyl-1,4-benzoquinol methylase